MSRKQAEKYAGEVARLLSEASMSESECESVADWLCGPVIAEDPEAADSARDYAIARVRLQRQRKAGNPVLTSMRTLVYFGATKRVLTMKKAGRLSHATPAQAGDLRKVLIAGGASPEEADTRLRSWGLVL